MLHAHKSYRSISTHLKKGGLIAYPTESCYGLDCDPDNRSAVLRLLKLKQRPQGKGLIVIAASYQQVARYLQPLSPEQQQQLDSAGAQATTYLMPCRHSTPRWLRGSHDTLAIRLTAYKPAKNLCRGVNSALVSTSANRSKNIRAMPAFVWSQGVGVAGACRETQKAFFYPRMGRWQTHPVMWSTQSRLRFSKNVVTRHCSPKYKRA